MPIRGAKAAILDPEGNVLIVRRSGTHPFVPFSSDLPGGKVEKGETMFAGLTRELAEEVGISTENLSVRLVGKNHEDNFYGREYDVELYEVLLTNRPNIVLDFEHDSYEWVPLADATIKAELFEEIFNSYRQDKLNS